MTTFALNNGERLRETDMQRVVKGINSASYTCILESAELISEYPWINPLNPAHLALISNYRLYSEKEKRTAGNFTLALIKCLEEGGFTTTNRTFFLALLQAYNQLAPDDRIMPWATTSQTQDTCTNPSHGKIFYTGEKRITGNAAAAAAQCFF